MSDCRFGVSPVNYPDPDYAFASEKGKTIDCSETVVVCDVKHGRCSYLND